jgi:hypothetical protein
MNWWVRWQKQDKSYLTPLPLAGRPPLRRTRVHKKFESPDAEASVYDTRSSGANLPLRRYEFRPSQGRAAGCCIRPGSPAICDSKLDIQLSKNAGSCCLGSRSNATLKHTVTILLCICQGEFTPKFRAETRGGLGLKPRCILNHFRLPQDKLFDWLRARESQASGGRRVLQKLLL